MPGGPGGPAGPAGPAGPVGPSGIDVFFERLRRLGVARATQGKVAGGVCAGLARRWNIDPLVARLVFVVLTVFGGFGPAASASNIVAGTVVPGSEPSDQAGNDISYLASAGMPSVWCTSTLP